MSESAQFGGVVLHIESIKSQKIPSKEKCFAFCGRNVEKNKLLVAFTLISVFVGIVLGIGLRYASLSENAKTLVGFPGEILLRLLKMMSLPLITTSIVTGVADLYKRKSGRVGLHIIIYYISTTFCAVCIGLALALAIQPGLQNRTLDEVTANETAKGKGPTLSAMDTVLDLLRNMFPENLIKAWFQLDQTKIFLKQISENSSSNTTTETVKSLGTTKGSNALGLVMFSLMVGIAIGKNYENLYRFFNELFHVFMDVLMHITWCAPVGICSLIAGNLVKVNSFLVSVKTLGLYLTTVVVGFSLQVLLVHFSVYWIITRRNPFRVLLGSMQAVFTMIAVSSSAATLPVTMHCAEENLKIDKRFTRLVLPLGATINMDGAAMFQGIVTVTVAQMNGISLSVGQIITVCVTGSLASIGAAAIPGSGLVVVVFVIQSIGLPIETIGLLYTVDWIIDRMRGIVNIVGDVFGVCVIAHLNRDVGDVSEYEVEALGVCEVDMSA